MSTATGGSPRVRSLDGLRGIAALIVMFHHALLTLPSLAAPYMGGPTAPRWSIAWWLTWTPLHLLWAGGECVIVFFVLSGYVLTLPHRSRLTPDWSRYVPQRAIRLYVPAIASVAVAAVIILTVPRHLTGSGSPWLLAHHDTLQAKALIRDVILVVDGPGYVNTVLWSLQWEVLFSLLLPLVVVVAVRWKGAGACVAIGAGTLIVISMQVDSLALEFLPMFVLGSLLVVHLPAWSTNRVLINPLRRSVVWFVCLALLLVQWLPGPAANAATLRDSATWSGIVHLAMAIGAAGVIALAVTSHRAGAVLSHRVVQWLGSRSFSLYLIHEPIIVTTAFAFRDHHISVRWAVPVGIALGLAAAEVFYRFVELPSLRWSRRVGSTTMDDDLSAVRTLS